VHRSWAAVAAVPEHDPYAPETEFEDALQLVQAAVEEAERHHIAFCEKVEKRYRAYRGVAEKKNEATDDWRSRLTTPYLLQTVEAMLATMLIPKPRWSVDPVVLPEQPIEMAVARKQTGRHVEIALDKEMQQDHFAQKQRPFMQQDMVVGFTVAKLMWRSERGYRKFLEPTITLVQDSNGRVIDSEPGMEEQDRELLVHDGPTFIVRDVRDWMWPESAKSVDEAAWIIDRSWETYDCLEQKQEMGLYENVHDLKGDEDLQQYKSNSEREQLLRNSERTDGLIEVLEYWTDERVITVGARKVVLSDQPNPFWHGKKPFIVCSSMPDAFQIPGISVVESLAQMQEYLWSLQNNRLDSIRLQNNLITLIRDDVDDPDSFEFYPGAQWFVTDPGQVSTLPVDPNLGQVTLEAESMIKGDLQNVMGGLPYAGSVNEVNQTTATGMSIVTSIAERMIKARTANYAWAYAKIGSMFLSMMAQFIRQERAYLIKGAGAEPQTMLLSPSDFQGDWSVDVDVMEESMMRQERRAEAQTLLQMAGQLAQVVPLNMKAFMTRVLDAYGVDQPEQFFSAEEQQGAAAGANGSAPPGIGPETPSAQTLQTQMTSQGPQGGQTNPALAGAHGLSQSPEMLAATATRAVQGVGG
jgi:hypothetical protein